ncbi:MAG: hypothetical protein R2771_15095 [Saprospiraceae bacterium]
MSADGHNWSTGAYATDYLEKNCSTSYGGRGGFYNAEGTREIANNKNGFIWNLVKNMELHIEPMENLLMITHQISLFWKNISVHIIQVGMRA